MNRYATVLGAFLALCSVSQAEILDLYVSYGASATSGGVAKYSYDTATTAATLDTGFTVSSDSNGLLTPQGLAVAGSVLYVAGQDSAATSSIKTYNRTTGAFLGNLLTSGLVDTPNAIAIGPDGNLYATEWTGTGANVKKVDLTTGVATTFTSGSSLVSAAGLAWGSDGNLYVSDSNSTSSIVQKFDGSTGASLGIFITPLPSRSVGLAFDSSGNLYTSASSTDTLNKYNSVGVSLGTFGSGLAEAQQITVGPDYNGDSIADLYVANAASTSTSISVLDGSTGANLGDLLNINSRPKAALFVANVPEPSAVVLLATGLIGLLAYAWRKRK